MTSMNELCLLSLNYLHMLHFLCPVFVIKRVLFLLKIEDNVQPPFFFNVDLIYFSIEFRTAEIFTSLHYDAVLFK